MMESWWMARMLLVRVRFSHVQRRQKLGPLDVILRIQQFIPSNTCRLVLTLLVLSCETASSQRCKHTHDDPGVTGWNLMNGNVFDFDVDYENGVLYVALDIGIVELDRDLCVLRIHKSAGVKMLRFVEAKKALFACFGDNTCQFLDISKFQSAAFGDSNISSLPLTKMPTRQIQKAVAEEVTQIHDNCLEGEALTTVTTKADYMTTVLPCSTLKNALVLHSHSQNNHTNPDTFRIVGSLQRESQIFLIVVEGFVDQERAETFLRNEPAAYLRRRQDSSRTVVVILERRENLYEIQNIVDVTCAKTSGNKFRQASGAVFGKGNKELVVSFVRKAECKKYPSRVCSENAFCGYDLSKLHTISEVFDERAYVDNEFHSHKDSRVLHSLILDGQQGLVTEENSSIRLVMFDGASRKIRTSLKFEARIFPPGEMVRQVLPGFGESQVLIATDHMIFAFDLDYCAKRPTCGDCLAGPGSECGWCHYEQKCSARASCYNAHSVGNPENFWRRSGTCPVALKDQQFEFVQRSIEWIKVTDKEQTQTRSHHLPGQISCIHVKENGGASPAEATRCEQNKTVTGRTGSSSYNTTVQVSVTLGGGAESIPKTSSIISLYDCTTVSGGLCSTVNTPCHWEKTSAFCFPIPTPKTSRKSASLVQIRSGFGVQFVEHARGFPVGGTTITFNFSMLTHFNSSDSFHLVVSLNGSEYNGKCETDREVLRCVTPSFPKALKLTSYPSVLPFAIRRISTHDALIEFEPFFLFADPVFTDARSLLDADNNRPSFLVTGQNMKSALGTSEVTCKVNNVQCKVTELHLDTLVCCCTESLRPSDKYKVTIQAGRNLVVTLVVRQKSRTSYTIITALVTTIVVLCFAILFFQPIRRLTSMALLRLKSKIDDIRNLPFSTVPDTNSPFSRRSLQMNVLSRSQLDLMEHHVYEPVMYMDQYIPRENAPMVPPEYLTCINDDSDSEDAYINEKNSLRT